MDELVIDQYRQWLTQVIEKDSEDLYKVPCPRCGTTRYRSQVALIMCENRLACNMARENLSDAVICVGQPGHQSADAKGKKRAAQAQHARSVERSGAKSKVTGANYHQDEHREEGGEQSANSPVLNEATRNLPASEAQQSVENGRNRGTSGSEDEDLLTGRGQPSTLGVSKTDGRAPKSSTVQPDARGPSSATGQTIRRQRCLNEIVAFTTDKCAPERHQLSEPLDSKPVLPLKKQTKRADTTYSPWVCTSLGAKQDQRSGVLQCQGTKSRCAECSSILVNGRMRDKCVRCKIPTYCGNQCKERHWTKKHHRECKHNTKWCPACGEDLASDEGANITCERCQGIRY